MHDELSKAYELLGVKPGVSNRDLKAAHRDLAKVWHPDRFLHDPRLQEKAQEKLKEINEAYELLSSGRMPRATPAYSQPQNPAPRRAKTGSSSIAMALLIFVAVFALTITYLLQRQRPPVGQSIQVEQPVADVQLPARKPDANLRSEAVPKPTPATIETIPSAPTTALATITVAIDPASGLLAKANCPVRSRLTYPNGSQPTSYCNIDHTPPPKESKIKSLAKTVQRALD